MSSLLINVIIYNAVVLIVLFLMLIKNPRYMMQDYPKEILKGIPQKTKKEKHEAMIFGVPFIIIIILFPLAVGIYGKFILDYGLIENWLRILVIMFSFNVVDLLIVDWLIFCLITPKFIVLPGTEGHAGYKNYMFHLYAFFKGTVMISIVSIIFALIIEGTALIF